MNKSENLTNKDIRRIKQLCGFALGISRISELRIGFRPDGSDPDPTWSYDQRDWIREDGHMTTESDVWHMDDAKEVIKKSSGALLDVYVYLPNDDGLEGNVTIQITDDDFRLVDDQILSEFFHL